MREDVDDERNFNYNRYEEDEVMPNLSITYLETMVSWACNLSCVGCTNFCDYPHKGFPDWEKVRNDLIQWNRIIDIEHFGLIGGEPLLNPRILDWIYGVREILKTSYIILVSNGLLFNILPDVIRAMIDISPGKLMITLQRNNEEIINQVNEFIKKSGCRFIVRDKSSKLVERELMLLNKSKNFTIHFVETDSFIKKYKGYGKHIYPFDSDNIQAAFNHCIERPILFEGKIYRCSKMALLHRQLQMLGQLSIPAERQKWEPYLNYQGLSYQEDLESVKNFLGRIHEAEFVCRSCPSEVVGESHIDHKDNVYSKSEWKEKFGTV